MKDKLLLIFSHYKLFEFKYINKKNRLLKIFQENTRDRPGLADRIKAAVSSYIIAKENGYDFFFYHDDGFRMEKYLEPNQIQWSIEKKDIQFGINRFSFLWFTSNMVKLKKHINEYHAHYIRDIYPNLSSELKNKYNYKDTFHKLFKFSNHLNDILNEARTIMSIKENDYIAIHVRFLDYFEAVESTPEDSPYIKHASKDEQAKMIKSVCLTLEKIHEDFPDDLLLLFSDSSTFLKSVNKEYIKIIPGEIGHIHAHSGNSNVTDKAFIDLILLSEAKQIFSITGDGTYKSGYPMLAARIGEKPFKCIERISV